jgi:hypothetical protein
MKMNAFDKVMVGMMSFLGLLLVAAIVWVFVSPVMEARLYERATGVQVTYWEAFCVDLDVSKHAVILEKK